MRKQTHTEDDGPLSQERYLSSSEFSEIRGISGRAVAEKVAFLTSPKQRELILFLQALSLEFGGIRKLANDILAAFPGRIGTPTMHKLGMKPGQFYSGEQ